MNKLLAVQNLSKAFKSNIEGKRYLWENLTFSLDFGQSLSICGESGSGKSTLLFALGGLEQVENGTIFFKGKPVTTQTPHIDGISYIFQHYRLLDELNVFENIILPLSIRGKKNDSAFFKALVEALQIGPLLQRMPNNLSGGERQRIAIARALVTQPQLLLADEPTGSLDEASGHKVMNLLFYVCKTFGTSFILVTHNVPFAKETDRFFYLKQGTLIDGKD